MGEKLYLRMENFRIEDAGKTKDYLADAESCGIVRSDSYETAAFCSIGNVVVAIVHFQENRQHFPEQPVNRLPELSVLPAFCSAAGIQSGL